VLDPPATIIDRLLTGSTRKELKIARWEFKKRPEIRQCYIENNRKELLIKKKPL
jgi:hypothetical protein